MNIFSFLAKLRNEGVVFTILVSLSRLSSVFRGFIYGFAIENRSAFQIGKSPKLLGAKSISIGKGCRFGDFLWLEGVYNYYGQKFSPRILIGDNVVINDFVHIGAANYISIGKGCLIASKVLITDHSHGVYEGGDQSSPHVSPENRNLFSRGEVIIGENVWIGEYVSILPGAKIGDGAIIGANSTVIGELPAFTICVGSPAKPVKKFSFEEGRWLAMSRRD